MPGIYAAADNTRHCHIERERGRTHTDTHTHTDTKRATAQRAQSTERCTRTHENTHAHTKSPQDCTQGNVREKKCVALYEPNKGKRHVSDLLSVPHDISIFHSRALTRTRTHI
jgi:hypothetical protein